ncbi:Zinc finger HIT domain-containing protein 1 [Chionoecetes opilio]|uniref:Zinc finger HIT domain-containing protein 1 n=1 Tax=Chionoecetes opilio TaxID=41210 RepID=A0A8J4XPI9_CHIOP|nr:Zinc finger HIT domain-containing protein 1 [Chionoecetes opilio]
MASRESGRQKDASARRILDESARRRRARKALEALEHDNFHDDPHANLVMSKKAPKFEESFDGTKNKDRKRKTRSSDYFKQSEDIEILENFTYLGSVVMMAGHVKKSYGGLA